MTVEPQDYGASGAQIPERGPLRVGSATQAQGPACGCPTVGFLGHSSSPPHRACDPIPSGHTPPRPPLFSWDRGATGKSPQPWVPEPHDRPPAQGLLLGKAFRRRVPAW